MQGEPQSSSRLQDPPALAQDASCDVGVLQVIEEMLGVEQRRGIVGEGKAAAQIGPDVGMA